MAYGNDDTRARLDSVARSVATRGGLAVALGMGLLVGGSALASSAQALEVEQTAASLAFDAGAPSSGVVGDGNVADDALVDEITGEASGEIETAMPEEISDKAFEVDGDLASDKASEEIEAPTSEGVSGEAPEVSDAPAPDEMQDPDGSPVVSTQVNALAADAPALLEAVEEADPVLPDLGPATSWRYQDGELVRIPNEDDSDEANGVSAYAARPYEPWEKVGSGYVNSNGSYIPGAVKRGIDVSRWDYEVDWDAVKADDVSFAIIRCGHHHNAALETDEYWERNAAECERLGIPYGVYFYAKATTVEEARQEAQYVVNLLRGKSPSLPVYYDLEDGAILDVGTDLAAVAKTFCDTIAAAGYQPGIYANLWWWNSFLTDPVFESWPRWVAQYAPACAYEGTYGIWQCTSQGSIDGIDGWVDINFMMDPTFVPDAGDAHVADEFYSDTPKEAWYVQEGWLDYVVANDLMTGDTIDGELSGTFRPEGTVLRGEVATVLYRYANPEASDTNDPSQYQQSTDFKDAQYPYYWNAAINWCAENGVITGYRDAQGRDTGYFGPNDPISREDLATMLARFAASYGGVDTSDYDEGTFVGLPDHGETHDYAVKSLGWCADQEIMTGFILGDGERELRPRATATRAEFAKMITVLTRDVMG